MSGKNAQNAQGALAPVAGDNQAVGNPVLPCKANNDPRLAVSVYCDTGGRKYIHASVKAAKGPANAITKTTVAATGLADYSYVLPGTYTITVESIQAPQDKDYFVGANATATATLAAGDNQTVQIAVERKNVVTPKIEGEYLAVLLERNLSQHQEATDPKKFYAGATYIELSFKETNAAYKHRAGAKITCTPANVDIFLDEKCRDQDKLDASGDLTDAQLRTGTNLKLWLRGKTAGKFTAKFELKDPADPKIRVEDPVELKMGVVELVMRVHKADVPGIKALTVNPDVASLDTYYNQLKNLDLPDPVEMTDADKVKVGRLLHLQKKKTFSRAKLLLKQYTQDHWPAGTDDYEVVFVTDDASGALKIHTKEWDDSAVKVIKLKVSDLKAKEHTYWLEGSAVTAVDTDVRYELGLDRASGGLAKTTKRNGDWARFKVVQIGEVKIDYTTPANAATAWDAANKRFYLNFQADPTGREVTIGAQLTTKLKDVDVHFMLAEDKDNRKKKNWGKDMPGTWSWHTVPAALKHKDKSARTELLHLTAKTDANGYAKVDLTLSRFAGDKFHPAAYLVEDAHLAKYVHGHADLKKKKPVTAVAGPISVWRKLWYQRTKPQGLDVPDPDLMVKAYKNVFTEVELTQTVDITAGNAPARTFYPESMFVLKSASAAQVVNIGAKNKNALSALLVTNTAHPVIRHLMVCLYQCDPQGTKNGTSDAISSDVNGTWVDLVVDDSLYVLDPPLDPAQASFIVQLYWYRQSAPAAHTAIPAADARVPVPRRSRGHIQVKVPAIAPAPTAADPVFIFAECVTAKGYLGESFNVRHTLAVYDKNDKTDFNDTITHEFGHSFNQTPRAAATPGKPGIPDHPNMADRGQGNHCQVNKGTALLSGDTKYICVMYDSGPMQWGKHKFCETCHPYLLAENFNRP